jgi:hypothetical protein
MDYDTLTRRALELLGENPTAPVRWSLQEVQDHVNMTIESIFEDMGDTSDIYTFNTIIGDDVYSLPADLQATSYVTIGTSFFKLDKYDVSEMPINGAEGTPNRYAISISGVSPNEDRYKMILYPVPSQILEVNVVYTGFLPLSSNDTIPVPKGFERVAVYGLAASLSTKLVANKNNSHEMFETKRNQYLGEATAQMLNEDRTIGDGWY